MECMGGNGYVEEGGLGTMARIYREMPLNSIWEGAGNIMALDLLRALRKGDVAQALAQELAPARGAHPALDRLPVKGLAEQRVPPGVALLLSRAPGAVEEVLAAAPLPAPIMSAADLEAAYGDVVTFSGDAHAQAPAPPAPLSRAQRGAAVPLPTSPAQ
jgi:hypothetical protein